MRWELDPDFALHSRLSFGRSTSGWLTLAIVGSIVTPFVVLNERVQAIFSIMGLILVAIAAPYGALHVISLERNHQLDLRRLTGRSSLGWMLASIFGTSWVLLVLAVPLLLASRHVGPGAIGSLAVMLMGLTVALLLLSAPQLHDADGRVLLALLLLIAVITTVAGWQAPAHPGVFLLAAGAAAGAALPAALRQMRRRRSVRRRSVPNPFRRLVRLSHTRLPELSRSVLMAGPSVVGAVIFGVPTAIGAVVRVSNEWPRVEPVGWTVSLGFIGYVALTIAALGCSTTARLEHASGGLDRMRLTSQRSWPVVVQMAAGDALPLVLLSLLCIGVIWLVDPSSAAARAWPAVATLALFGGLAEGLQGRKLGSYIIPTAVICLLWHLQDASWWLLLLTAFLPAASAAACLADAERRSSRAPIEMMTGAAVIAAAATALPSPFDGFANSVDFFIGHGVAWKLTLVPLLTFSSAPMLAALLSLGAGALFAGGERRRTILAALATAWLAAATLTAVRPQPFWLPGSTPARAAVAGTFAAAGLLFGSLVQRRLRQQTAAAMLGRIAPLASIVIWWTFLPIKAGTDIAWVARTKWDAWFFAALAAACAILLLLEWRDEHVSPRRS